MHGPFVSAQTVLPPTTVCLIAGAAVHLKTRLIAFLGLNFSDKVSLFQTFCFDAQFFRFFLHFRHFHGQSPFSSSLNG
jgi:hypothetical protein